MTGTIDPDLIAPDLIAPDLIAEATHRFMHLREHGDEAARMALRRWMAIDVRHAAAIDLVERGWRKAGVLAPVRSAHVPRRRPNARHAGAEGRSASPRRLAWATGLAAALLLLIGAEHRGVGFGWPNRYATGSAARDIALVDGSRLRLQPHSQATVRLSLFSRDIALAAGGGAFIVAHEPLRPFIVHAGTIGVEATGTRFSVTTGAAGTHVALWQGGVRLRDRTSAAVLAYMKPGDRAAVGSGGRMVMTHARPAAQPLPRVFMFDNTPLSDAIAQIAAGTGLRTRFSRSDLAQLPVSSVYHGNDFSAFLDDLEAVEPICWRRLGKSIEIFTASSKCHGPKSPQ